MRAYLALAILIVALAGLNWWLTGDLNIGIVVGPMVTAYAVYGLVALFNRKRDGEPKKTNLQWAVIVLQVVPAALAAAMSGAFAVVELFRSEWAFAATFGVFAALLAALALWQWNFVHRKLAKTDN